MTKEINDTKIENTLHKLLNPVFPSEDFIDRLQNRLMKKSSIMVENPNYVIPILFICFGLFFGLLVYWIFRKVNRLFIKGES